MPSFANTFGWLRQRWLALSATALIAALVVGALYTRIHETAERKAARHDGAGRISDADLEPGETEETAPTGFQSSEGSPEPGAEAEGSADKSASDESSGAAADEAPDDWMAKVDGVFGKYLVKPLATVLFFDFFTGDRKDEQGNVVYEGWLGTSVPFVVFWLFVGAIFFTLRMGFINIRGFWHAVRLTKGDYDDPNKPGEVTHFQALSSALSATVGLGNIAGVAIAIGIGGPGATFWMIVVGLLGMSSKFAECTLGQLYRKIEPDGTISGGAMHYLRDGLADLGLRPLGAVLAVVFAVLCIGASFGGGNAFQVGQSLDAMRQEFTLLDKYPWIYGLTMALLAGLVIIGGIRSIAAVASKIVPLMCIAYVTMAVFILFENVHHVGTAFAAIFAGALSWKAGLGGLLGVMVVGIQRAVFSNEAGIGSAAIAHSAAKTDEPVSEGIVALLEPFIDTVVICTMTALVIVITGVYENPDYAHFIAGPTKSGAALTRAAVSGEHGVWWFRYVLYAAVFLFAYSTLISWSYYGERCWVALVGVRWSMVYKVAFLVFTVLGSIVTTGNILDFSDLLILGMSLPNILGVALLSGKVRRALDAYWEKYKSGKIAPVKKRVE